MNKKTPDKGSESKDVVLGYLQNMGVREESPSRLDSLSQYVADYPVHTPEDPELEIRTHGIRKVTREIIEQAYDRAQQRDKKRAEKAREHFRQRVVLKKKTLTACTILVFAVAFGLGRLSVNPVSATNPEPIASIEKETPVLAKATAPQLWCPQCREVRSMPSKQQLVNMPHGPMCTSCNSKLGWKK